MLAVHCCLLITKYILKKIKIQTRITQDLCEALEELHAGDVNLRVWSRHFRKPRNLIEKYSQYTICLTVLRNQKQEKALQFSRI